MPKKILVLNGSPKRNGNTAKLAGWFAEGARSKGADVEIVRAAFLKYRSSGCVSCRRCQKIKEYECAIDDDARPVLKKMAKADVIVFATPLYFYGPSAQLKVIIDRMFSLYKWDNTTDTFESPLKGKTMALLLSAYENTGLGNVERSFRIIADYSEMKFKSFLVPDARESGEVVKLKDIRKKTAGFGKKIAFIALLIIAVLGFAAGGMAEGGGKMKVTSPDFENNNFIPRKFTCDGENISPGLIIEGIPKEAKSLVLIVDDPDASSGMWVHWVAYDIPVTGRIDEGSAPGKQGTNSSGDKAYDGPRPPSGTHRYFFKVYALDTALNLKEGAKKQDLEKVMQGHILEKAELMGLYKRVR